MNLNITTNKRLSGVRIGITLPPIIMEAKNTKKWVPPIVVTFKIAWQDRESLQHESFQKLLCRVLETPKYPKLL